MISARASHSFWLITLRLSKSATFLGSEMRFIAWLGLGLGLGLGSGLGLGLTLTVTLTLWDDCAAHALHVASAGACPSEVYSS